jgi:hypothetical protein
MTRLPAFSTSADGRSNVISRVPRPSFLKPMKGTTHMQSPYTGPPWTPQRTRALFRLFTTSAPPDFRRQILERLAQRQHALVRQRLRRRSPRAWRVGTLRPRRRWRRRVLATVGWCGLVLGVSLAWWAAQTGPAAPAMPTGLVSRAVSPPSDPEDPTDALIRLDPTGWPGRAEPHEAVVRVADLPESVDTALHMQPGTAGERSMTSQASEEPERTLPGPVPVPRLTAQKERHSSVRRPTQRSERSRGAPGKAARLHKRPATGQPGAELTAGAMRRQG